MKDESKRTAKPYDCDPSPCETCGNTDFCSEHPVRCDGFDYWTDTGIAPERSSIGWVA